jgi:uncharacterized SAM-binding protein YcdF (DUF218 family)
MMVKGAAVKVRSRSKKVPWKRPTTAATSVAARTCGATLGAMEPRTMRRGASRRDAPERSWPIPMRFTGERGPCGRPARAGNGWRIEPSRWPAASSAGPRLASALGAAILGRVRRYDAVLVPGSGLRPGGALPPFVLDRLEAAQALAGEAPIIPLSAHTFHRPPPLDAAGFPVLESIAAARALLARGVPAGRIWAETGLARHHRQRLLRPRIHTDPAGLRRLLVVNSEFHMPRTRMVFDWVFGLPPAEPPYALDYHTLPDRGLTEAASRRGGRRRRRGWRTAPHHPAHRQLAALHRWLFTEHRAYAAGADPRSDAPPAAALDS